MFLGFRFPPVLCAENGPNLPKIYPQSNIYMNRTCSVEFCMPHYSVVLFPIFTFQRRRPPLFVLLSFLCHTTQLPPFPHIPCTLSFHSTSAAPHFFWYSERTAVEGVNRRHQQCVKFTPELASWSPGRGFTYQTSLPGKCWGDNFSGVYNFFYQKLSKKQFPSFVCIVTKMFTYYFPRFSRFTCFKFLPRFPRFLIFLVLMFDAFFTQMFPVPFAPKIDVSPRLSR